MIWLPNLVWAIPGVVFKEAVNALKHITLNFANSIALRVAPAVRHIAMSPVSADVLRRVYNDAKHRHCAGGYTSGFKLRGIHILLSKVIIRSDEHVCSRDMRVN
jgi:hypothetical protein